MQLREDYYPVHEDDTSTEMRTDSCRRFEEALASLDNLFWTGKTYSQMHILDCIHALEILVISLPLLERIQHSRQCNDLL